VIDVSNQAPITLAAYRQSKAVALIAKATEGTSFKDKTLSGHRTVASMAGTPFGSYLFLHPDSKDSEAKFYLDYAKPRPGEFQPIIDAEVLNLGTDELARRILSCSKALEEKGYDPLLYVSQGVWGQLVASQPYLKRLRVWEAQYPGRFSRWFPRVAKLRRRLKGARVVLWQWTDRYAAGGRHYDASVLLAPLDSLLITHPKKKSVTPEGGKARIAT